MLSIEWWLLLWPSLLLLLEIIFCDVAGNPHRRRQARALDPEEVNKPVETYVSLMANNEILESFFSRPDEFRPDTAVATGEILLFHVWEVDLDGLDGSIKVLLVDFVVGASVDPLEVGTKANLTAEVKCEMRAKGGHPWCRTRVDETTDVCVGPAVAEIVPLGVVRLDVLVWWEHHIGYVGRIQACTVDDIVALDAVLLIVIVLPFGVARALCSDLVHAFSLEVFNSNNFRA